MKYIQEQPFLDRKNNQIIIPSRTQNNEVVNFEPTLKWTLASIANAYMPTTAFSLTIGEIRLLNNAIDVLEATNEENEYLAFEDEEFNVLKKVILHFLPSITVRQILMNAPKIEDLLNSALDKIPKKEKDNKIKTE